MARRQRQTREAFPTDRLYSTGRIWVQPGPERTARMGINIPAISERMPHLYFIDVQAQGYLIEGKELGGVELDASRLELTAPLTGRITKVNWEAVHDPLLVMTDPFGEGWIYELGKVKPGSFARLLDRDALWSLLEVERAAKRFGLPRTLTASYRLDRGLPWPEDLDVRFGGISVLTGRILRLGRNQTFTPQWAPGERWKVETRYEQPALSMLPAEFTAPREVVSRWLYEVIDVDGAVDGAPCYVVRVTEVGGPEPQSHLLLSIGKEDFALRLVEEVSVFDPARRTRTPNDWGRETFLELRQPREVILDLPLFPLENRDEERTVSRAGEPRIQQQARFPDERTMAIACEAPLPGGERLRSEQTWERGLPWWREATRSIGDRVVLSGRLLREGEE